MEASGGLGAKNTERPGISASPRFEVLLSFVLGKLLGPAWFLFSWGRFPLVFVSFFFLYDVGVRERSECGSGAFPGSKWGIRVWFLGFCRGGGVVGFKQRRRSLVGLLFSQRVMSNPVD